MESLTAATLPARAKPGAWNELYSLRVEKVGFAAPDWEAFAGALAIHELDPIRIIRLSCGRCTIDRTPRHIDRAVDRVYTFILQTRGNGVFMQYGHEAALGTGDFTLCHGEAPYTYQLGDDCEVVLVRVPAGLVKEHLPAPESFCGRRLAAGEGLTETAATLITSLCAPLSAGLKSEFQLRVARHVLSMIATSYAIAFESNITASSNVGAWHARARLYIEQHLRTPDLTPCSIASKLKLSPRYLRMIFASGNETVSAYILRRRLEECARQIEDPRWSDHSITEIAFSWGFNSAPHFTRSFRDRYGIAPRRYRDRHGFKKRRRPLLSSPTASAPPQESPLPGPTQPASRGSF